MADTAIASVNIDFLDAEWAPEEGGPGFYYSVEGSSQSTGPFETEELAIAAVEEFLTKCAVDFVKQNLNLE